MSSEQQGMTVIRPPHKASYRYRNSSKNSSYMVSFMVYLNRYTQSGAIGLIQIDIPYEKIKQAIELLEMTEDDFSFIVDENNCLIYAPEQEKLGKMFLM